jgi:hypothetical protein
MNFTTLPSIYGYGQIVAKGRKPKMNAKLKIRRGGTPRNFFFHNSAFIIQHFLT